MQVWELGNLPPSLKVTGEAIRTNGCDSMGFKEPDTVVHKFKNQTVSEVLAAITTSSGGLLADKILLMETALP